MTKDEALKLALEALERCVATCFDPYAHEQAMSWSEHFVNQTITAIKEALAQPEQLMRDQINYGMSVTQGGKRIDPMSIYKEPEQEPVAWMDDYNACKCPDNEARCFSDKVFRMMQKHTDSLAKQQEPVARVCHDLDGHIGWNPNLLQLPDEGTPLYTTPPPVAEPHKRKPLTREQVLKIWKESGYDEALMEERAHFINGIRHAEFAHGIKDET